MKKLLIVIVSAVMLTACSKGQSEPSFPENAVEMPKDCSEYFGALKQLAIDNQNLADKFGDKLDKVNQSWQKLNQADRATFSEQCVLRNQQLKQLQKDPVALESFLNSL